MRRLKIALGSLALMSAPAMAVTILPTSANYVNGGAGGGIHVGSLGVNEYGPTGQFAFNGTVVGTGAAYSVLTYCFDVTKGVFTNDVNHLFEQRTVSSFSTDPLKQQQLAGLLTGSTALINAASTQAQRDQIAVATGLAVWELTYEATSSPYSVTGTYIDSGNGNFFTYGDFAPYQTLANSYLANVKNGAWTGDVNRVLTLISIDGQSQNQVFLSTLSAVPEPATWAFMIFGFGATGVVLRRRRALLAAALA